MLSAGAIAGPASDVLRKDALTPAVLEASLRRSPGADDWIDADALADIGIDLDAVRSRVEATFGPGALCPVRARQRRRPVREHLPLTGGAPSCLRLSAREARRYGEDQTGRKHLVLALTSATGGLAPRVSYDLGVGPAAVHDELVRRLGAPG